MSAAFGFDTGRGKVAGAAGAPPAELDRGLPAGNFRRQSSRVVRGCLSACAISVLLFLCLPIVIIVPMSFSSASSLTFPPPGLSLRWYIAFFGDARWLQAMWTSVLVAFASSGAALVLGGMAAYGLARARFPGRAFIEGNFILPSILPPIITAVALYIAFARAGLLGTLLGLVIGHTVLAVPYVVLVLAVAIRGFDVRIEQVAYTLGASWLTTFRRIVLPNLIPSIVAAWIFAFISSFDEVIVTVFLAGTYETVPKRMFNELVLQINPTITAIASLLIGLSLFSVVAVAALTRARGGILGSAAGTGRAR
jgi:putative spermidine/putrescine transport system permease protein